MSYQCPQCGATYTIDETCQERFDICMLKEVENPTSYYSVHHLSVPCFMLQHNVYSREGWLGARELLRQFVHEGLEPAAARRQNRKKLDSRTRTFSLIKGPKLAQVDEIKWTYVIADVRLDTADHYCADVRQWAERVLADTQTLVRMPGASRPGT